jgi:hypothetical protein
MNDLVTEYTPEQLEREFLLDDSTPLPAKGGVAALMRSAGAMADLEIFSAETDAPDRLERDGSQFILITCALLEWFGVNEDAREFVQWMEGIANGNFTEPVVTVDEQIATVIGCGVRTVERKRAALMEWQKEKNTSLIEVVQGKFNPEKGRNDPTEYTVHIGANVAAFVRKARENPAFMRNPVRSIEQAEENGLIELVLETKDELNPNLDVRRKEKKEAQPPKEDKVVKCSEARRRLRRSAEKVSDLTFELGEDVEAELETVISEIRQIFAGAALRYETKKKGKKPRNYRPAKLAGR